MRLGPRLTPIVERLQRWRERLAGRGEIVDDVRRRVRNDGPH